MKVLYCHYENGFAIIELIGEWNDLLYNDIMFLKREVIETMMQQGVSKFILIGENILNFHSSDDSYYEEWFEEVNDSDGWIALMNVREHVLSDINAANIDSYFVLGGKLNEVRWRTMNPDQLFESVERHVMRRLTT
jgi:F0F1-type ATP synthase gamma subunit